MKWDGGNGEAVEVQAQAMTQMETGKARGSNNTENQPSAHSVSQQT